MRRGLLTLLVIGAVLAVLALVRFGRAGPDAVAPLAIDAVRGEVVARIAGVDTPAAVGMALGPGDEVRTGPEAEATLSRAGRSPVTLAGNSALRVVRVDRGVVEIALDAGRLRVRAHGEGSAVRVVARARALRAVQAEAEVSVGPDGTLGADVIEGQVEIEGAPGVDVVRAGQRVVASDLGARVLDIPDAPLLEVAWPEAGLGPKVRVEGRAEPFAWVRSTDGASARADGEGRFAIELVLPDGSDEIALVTQDALGGERRVVGQVRRERGAPTYRIDLGGGAP